MSLESLTIHKKEKNPEKENDGKNDPHEKRRSDLVRVIQSGLKALEDLIKNPTPKI